MNTKKQNSSRNLFLGCLLMGFFSLFTTGCSTNQQYIEDPALKESIVILIQKVEHLESLHHISHKKTKIPVYSKKTNASKVISHVSKKSKSKLRKCDKDGWCHLDKQKGYVQKWRFSNH